MYWEAYELLDKEEFRRNFNEAVLDNEHRKICSII